MLVEREEIPFKSPVPEMKKMLIQWDMIDNLESLHPSRTGSGGAAWLYTDNTVSIVHAGEGFQFSLL